MDPSGQIRCSKQWRKDWEPVPRTVFFPNRLPSLISLFLFQAAQGTGVLLMIDLVFIPIHEGGHLLFRFLGEFLNIAGGTFLQLAVPLMLATYFAFCRQVQGVTFCMFFFFTSTFLLTATYMARCARAGIAAPHGWRRGLCDPRLELSIRGVLACWITIYRLHISYA